MRLDLSDASKIKTKKRIETFLRGRKSPTFQAFFYLYQKGTRGAQTHIALPFAISPFCFSL